MTDKTERSNSLKQALKRRKITKWLVISISTMIVIFGAYELGRHNHLWGESDMLRMIKSERLASENLLGLTLISSKQSGEGGLVQKTVTPSVTREFKVDPKDIDKTVKEIIAYAESDGWVYDPSVYTGQTNKRIWRKTLKSGTRLVLYIEDNNNIIVRVSGHDSI